MNIITYNVYNVVSLNHISICKDLYYIACALLHVSYSKLYCTYNVCELHLVYVTYNICMNYEKYE